MVDVFDAAALLMIYATGSMNVVGILVVCVPHTLVLSIEYTTPDEVLVIVNVW